MYMYSSGRWCYIWVSKIVAASVRSTQTRATDAPHPLLLHTPNHNPPSCLRRVQTGAMSFVVARLTRERDANPPNSGTLVSPHLNIIFIRLGPPAHVKDEKYCRGHHHLVHSIR